MDEIRQVKVGETAGGEPIMQRVMTADQVRERAQLNVQVTAASVRARALAHTNGHRNGNGNGHGKLSAEQLRPL